MIYYDFGLVRDRKRLKFAIDRSLNYKNLTGRSPAKQDLSSDSRKKFGQPPKKIAKILKKVPFASFSFIAAIPQILDLFNE